MLLYISGGTDLKLLKREVNHKNTTRFILDWKLLPHYKVVLELLITSLDFHQQMEFAQQLLTPYAQEVPKVLRTKTFERLPFHNNCVTNMIWSKLQKCMVIEWIFILKALLQFAHSRTHTHSCTPVSAGYYARCKDRSIKLPTLWLMENYLYPHF